MYQPIYIYEAELTWHHTQIILVSTANIMGSYKEFILGGKVTDYYKQQRPYN